MQPISPPPILTIAGSDPSGGAGIQADLKTILACGGYGMAAITALTAQNTLGVFGVHSVPPEFVAQQIRMVLADIGAAAIKTGMLARKEIIEAVAASLSPPRRRGGRDAEGVEGGASHQKSLPNEPVGERAVSTRSVDPCGSQQASAGANNVSHPPLGDCVASPPPLAGGAMLVVDPVMIAKGGASLLAEDAVEAMVQQLLPLAMLVTPNIPEAECLSGQSIRRIQDMESAAQAIVALGPQAVLIKGGHLDSGSEVQNLLLTQSGERHVLTSPRIDTQHTHGTGCTLSAAIATYLGCGKSLLEACESAEAYVAGAIKYAPGLGGGHGPLAHGWNLFRH